VRIANDPRHGPLPALLLVMTFVTGLVDATSIIALGRVFVANMTGNVVFLGFALAGVKEISLYGTLAALAGFLLGALAGGQIRVSHRGRTLRDAALAEAGLMAVATIVLVAAPQIRVPVAVAVAAILGSAMGAQAAVVRKLAVPQLNTNVLTMTLTGIVADGPGGRGFFTVRVLAVTAMFAGGAVGAALVLRSRPSAAIILGAVLLAAVAGAAAFTARHRAPWHEPM